MSQITRNMIDQVRKQISQERIILRKQAPIRKVRSSQKVI